MKSDIEQLKIEEKEVLNRLTTAREMGDLSENGAYKYAKFELGSLRRKMNHLTKMVNKGFEITKPAKPDKVGFGCSVTIKSGDTEMTVMIVNKHESDFAKQKLSNTSPIGQAIMHKKVGDVILIQTPGGEKEYTILKIS